MHNIFLFKYYTFALFDEGYIVACYTDNLKWCRGRVELVVDNKTIQIFLVDYGKIIVVSSNMIRELLDSFYEIEPMVNNFEFV